jgi:aryl-alcohol dehydrogenase-like predicted oxidoreductase
MSDLPRRTLGKTGLDVSVLGYGAAPAAFLKEDHDRVTQLVNSLLDSGVNLLDTATGYPGSQAFIGENLSSRRDDYVLVSKVGNSGNPDSFKPERVHKDVDNALKLMKTDHVDVMLLHSCPLSVLEADDALGALVEARDAGKIKHCGYSGDNDAAAFAARLPDIAVIETSVNIADQANVDAVLPKAKTHDVGIIVKRPIANAAWKDLEEQRGFYQKYAKTYTERLAKMDLDPSKFDLDWPELALRWTLMQDAVTTAIVGTTNPDNAEANLKLAAMDPLPDDVASAVREAFAQVADESWTGQT